MKSVYTKNFDCDPQDPFQQKLNEIYRYKDHTQYMHRLRINLFYDLVTSLIGRKIIKSTDFAMDIGCNCGVYSQIISDLGFKKVLGLDIDSSAIDYATRYFASSTKDKSISFEVANAEVLDTDKKCDFILCTEVIEHTDEPQKVIHNVAELLKPGGVAIVSLPNAFSMPYMLTYLSYKAHRRPFNKEMRDHLSYPFYRSKKVFDKEDLELVETSGTNLFYWHFMHKWPFFKTLNKANYYMAKTGLLKNFSQFFFLVLVKPEVNAASVK